MPVKLILFPAPLSENGVDAMPRDFNQNLRKITHLVCERGKTARAQMKKIDPDFELSSIDYIDLPKHAKPKDLDFIYTLLDKSEVVMGFMSEAGLPAVADPGSEIVAYCHKKGYKIHPLSGPSSFMMALMASGLNGQRFRMLGYLPIDSYKRKSEIAHLVKLANKGETQIFMETPYRNNQLVEVLLKELPGSLSLCIATDISGDGEWIVTKPVGVWQKRKLPDLHKRPTVFLVGR